MFFYRMRLFSLFGFDVYVDASWLLIAVLIAWSLAVGVFPGIVSGLTPAAYWSMAVVATVGPVVLDRLPRNVPCGGSTGFRYAHPRHHPFYLRRCRRDAQRADERA